MVSSEHFKYHGQELPIIYSEVSRLRTILVGKVETLFKQYKNCLRVDPSIESVYRYDVDNLMIYEMLRASCSDGVSELLKTWERESFKIIQEGVLAAWLSFDGYRLNNQIHKPDGLKNKTKKSKSKEKSKNKKEKKETNTLIWLALSW